VLLHVQEMVLYMIPHDNTLMAQKLLIATRIHTNETAAVAWVLHTRVSNILKKLNQHKVAGEAFRRRSVALTAGRAGQVHAPLHV
jgi:succinylglutamate desuccinylase